MHNSRHTKPFDKITDVCCEPQIRFGDERDRNPDTEEENSDANSE